MDCTRLSFRRHVTILSRDGVTAEGFGLIIGFIDHLQNITPNDYEYDSLTELHTPKIMITAAYIKSPQFSLAVAW
jgi:hypothetical protein